MTEAKSPPTRLAAPPGGGLFRQKALDNLTAPSDQLDQLMRVTSPRGWLALVALISIVLAAVLYGFFGQTDTVVDGRGIFLPPGGLIRVQAAEPGTTTAVHVRPGHEVEEGDVLAELQDGDGSTSTITAPADGHLIEVLVDEGNVLSAGRLAFVLEPHDQTVHAVVYVPASAGKAIEPGMLAYLSPSTAPSEEYGQILGEVMSVSEFPASPERLEFVLNNRFLIEQFAELGPLLEVTTTVELDEATTSGFAWTSGSGPPFEVGHGTLTGVSVILDQQPPARRLFGGGS